jgi:aldehyde:ferredoxin oxidoreductase
MAGGYAGKILKVDLTTRVITTIDSQPYLDEHLGGHGVGSRLFWDEVVEKGDWDMLDGFDVRNQVSIMSGPMSGTLMGCASRSEVQGVAPQKWPVNWFSRSGFGGRFGAMMRYAGWDGIIVQGKASSPVWINVINDNVTIEDAGPDGDNLWGLTTHQAGQEIWKKVRGNRRLGEWMNLGEYEYTMQQPAVVACGPVGEALSRVGSLVHDKGSGAGQGGYGGVFGSKNLKAISFLGSGSIEIADPGALHEARSMQRELYSYNVDYPTRPGEWRAPTHGAGGMNFTNLRRGTGCHATSFNCRQHTYTSSSNDSQCSDVWYGSGKDLRDRAWTTDLAQGFGINLFGNTGVESDYLRDLYELGELGPGKTIESSPLNMEDYGSNAWCALFLKTIADRTGIGDDLAEGVVRASTRWGRYEEDSGPNRLLNTIHWGDRWHHAAEKWWLFGSLFGERDVNEHCTVYSSAHVANRRLGTADEISPEELANEMADGNPGPWKGEPYVWSQTWQGPNGEWTDDALETGWYSEYGAKEVAWHRYYSRSWLQSLGNCCWNYGIAFGNFHCMQNPDYQGLTAGGLEPMFYNAVTGRNMSFADVMEVGRKNWNLDRAIWVLQGRHKDNEHFTASRQYEYPGRTWANRAMPSYRNGVWEYQFYNTPEESPFNDRDMTETFKGKYYALEGWDTSTGAPTRATLEGVNLGFVADKLEAEGKI